MESGDVVSGSFAVVLPDEPAPVRLMNTIWADRSGVHDALSTTAGLAAWLAAAQPGDGAFEVGPADLECFRRLRDALRRLAALVTDDQRATAASPTGDAGKAVREVNEAAHRSHTWPQLSYRDGELVRVDGHDHADAGRALAGIARDAVELLTGPGRAGLRACRAPGCVLYFVRDHPRREWCSAACGNRARVARHYQRHSSRGARQADI